MAGPWEQYQSTDTAAAPQDGPWTRYGAVPDESSPAAPFQKSQQVATLGPAGVKKAIAETIAADVSPMGAKFVGAIGTAADDLAYRLKQLTGQKLTPQEDARVRENRAFVDVGGMPAIAGNVTGNLLSIGGPAASLYGGAATLAGRALPSIIAPTVAAAVTGGTQGFVTQPVLEGESALKNVGIGAAGGVVGDTLARGLSRIVQPIMQSQPVQRMLSEGIVPTPGQAAGGVANRIEQKVESLIGPGDFIRLGRDRAQREFNQAFLGKGVPGGGRVSQIGPDGINELKGGLSSAYDRIFSGHTVKPDQALTAAIDAAKNVPSLPLNSESIKQFDQIIARDFTQRIPAGGSISADEMKKQIIGDIGKAAKATSSIGSTASERSLGEALYEARNRIQDWLITNVGKNSQQAAAELSKVDTAYAAMRTAEKAVERAKASGGQFTPYQAQVATRPGTPLREFANDAQAVLGNRVPNSGSIDRAAVAAILGLGTAGANEYFGGPGYLTALAASPLLYSRAGSRYMVGDLIPGQAALSGILRGAAPQAAGILSLEELARNRQ